MSYCRNKPRLAATRAIPAINPYINTNCQSRNNTDLHEPFYDAVVAIGSTMKLICTKSTSISTKRRTQFRQYRQHNCCHRANITHRVSILGRFHSYHKANNWNNGSYQCSPQYIRKHHSNWPRLESGSICQIISHIRRKSKQRAIPQGQHPIRLSNSRPYHKYQNCNRIQEVKSQCRTIGKRFSHQVP